MPTSFVLWTIAFASSSNCMNCTIDNIYIYIVLYYDVFDLWFCHVFKLDVCMHVYMVWYLLRLLCCRVFNFKASIAKVDLINYGNYTIWTNIKLNAMRCNIRNLPVFQAGKIKSNKQMIANNEKQSWEISVLVWETVWKQSMMQEYITLICFKHH